MMSSEVMNPWKIQSIYDLLYFHCPSCDFINQSKQQFVNHAFDSHPNNTIEYLSIICDGSLDDVVCPWDIKNIKTEVLEENSSNNTQNFLENNSATTADFSESNFDDGKNVPGALQKRVKKFKCNECNKPFRRSKFLRVHMQKCKNTKYCGICKISLPTEFYKFHVSDAHEKKTLNEKNSIIDDPLKLVQVEIKQ